MKLSLFKSTYFFGLYTFISRILGFLRDISFAYFLGAGIILDAFLLSFKIPNIIKRLLSDGAFNYSFIPVIMEYKEIKNIYTFLR